MRERLTTAQRGYGGDHPKERRRWQIIVDHEGYICTRCHKYAPPGTPFDLDHNEDRTAYLGAAHVGCNRGAGGRKARARARMLRIRRRSRDW